jgi:hypothetical protein
MKRKEENTMKSKSLVATLLFLLAAFPLSAMSAELTTTLTVTNDDLLSANATQFLLSFAAGGAEITISQSEREDIVVEAVVTYDSTRPEPTLSISSSGGEFSARFVSGFEIDPVNVSTAIEQWDVVMGSYDIDTDFVLSGGGVAGRSIDLGGLPLRNCTLNLGGVGMDVDFSTPTTRPVDELTIEGGGITLSVANIGNTDFAEFSLVGGGFTAEMDFQGAYTREQHRATIIGAGNRLDIIVPSDAGEQVEILSVAALVSVEGMGWSTARRSILFKNFVTDGYDAESVKIDMDLVAVGSVVTIDRQ